MQKLYYGGDIITMRQESDTTEALLEKDGVIQYVGTLEEAEALCEESVHKICLNGKTLMPAFIDPHSHLTMLAQFSALAPLGSSGSFQDIVANLRAYRDDKELGDGDVLMGFGYDHKQQRYEDEVLKCLEGESAFSQEMLARLITQAEAEVRQAKDEYAALLQNNDDRTTVQQIRSYYDEFLGWANEFSLATVERKRAILAQLFEKVEIGKGYKITIHVRGTYRQFLMGGDPHGEL